jgi:hypothetical protein
MIVCIPVVKATLIGFARLLSQAVHIDARRSGRCGTGSLDTIVSEMEKRHSTVPIWFGTQEKCIRHEMSVKAGWADWERYTPSAEFVDRVADWNSSSRRWISVRQRNCASTDARRSQR